MNQRRSFVVLLAVAFLFGVVVFSASASADVAAPVFQSPVREAAVALTAIQPSPVNIGQELVFEMQLAVANINPGVGAAEVYLGYNPLLVSPTASPGQPIAEVLPDFFGVASVSVNEILLTCPVGSGPCLHLVVAGPPQVTKTGAIARFHFTALAEGQGCFTVFGAQLADADGFPVAPVTLPTGSTCVQINSRSTITGTILRQGTPGNPNPGGGSLMCSEARVVNTALAAVAGANGNFSIADVPPGTYTVEASYSGYLRAAATGVVVQSGVLTVPVGTVRLLGGDANGDGVINILDVGSVISEFGRTGVPVRSDAPDCLDSDDPNDINDDGIVNIGDLAIVAGNWGKVGPTAWVP